MNKENSRKWRLTKWAFWVLTALLVLPGIASVVLTLLGINVIITLMTPELYITGLGLIVGLYGGANVLQKKFLNGNGNGIKKGDNLSEAPGTGSGGQPPEPPEIPVNT